MAAGFLEAVYRVDETGNRPVRTAIFSVARSKSGRRISCAVGFGSPLRSVRRSARRMLFSCERCQPSRQDFCGDESDNRAAAGIETSSFASQTSARKSRCSKALGLVHFSKRSQRTPATKLGLNVCFFVYDEAGSAPSRHLFDALDSPWARGKTRLAF